MSVCWIDTHCHLETEAEGQGLLAEARAEKVGVIAIGGSSQLNVVAERSGTWFTQGLDWSAHAEETCVPAKDNPRLVAIGELGFDFHYARGAEVERLQCTRFEQQVQLAKTLELPIVVHTREADDITVAQLRMADVPRTGVIHSYTGGISLARVFLDMGYYISFSGIVTFRNAATVRDVARYVPEDRILVETDAPYLAPVPLRGQRNRPCNVRITADFIAALRGRTSAAFAEETTSNACRLFRLL